MFLDPNGSGCHLSGMVPNFVTEKVLVLLDLSLVSIREQLLKMTYYCHLRGSYVCVGTTFAVVSIIVCTAKSVHANATEVL
jgi:hypothetical protein